MWRSSTRLIKASRAAYCLPSRPSGMGQGKVPDISNPTPQPDRTRSRITTGRLGVESDTIYGRDCIAVRPALAYSAALDTTPPTRVPVYWDKSASASSEATAGLWRGRNSLRIEMDCRPRRARGVIQHKKSRVRLPNRPNCSTNRQSQLGESVDDYWLLEQ